MTPGERIRSIRKSLGMTQIDLAEKFGISKKTISRIEHDLNLDSTRAHTDKRFKREAIRLWAEMNRR